MRFFQENFEEHRLPRTMIEGAIKGLFLAAFLMSVYDILTETPNEKNLIVTKAKTIIGGYLLLTFLGAFLGFIGQLDPNNQHEVRQRR